MFTRSSNFTWMDRCLTVVVALLAAGSLTAADTVTASGSSSTRPASEVRHRPGLRPTSHPPKAGPHMADPRPGANEPTQVRIGDPVEIPEQAKDLESITSEELEAFKEAARESIEEGAAQPSTQPAQRTPTARPPIPPAPEQPSGVQTPGPASPSLPTPPNAPRRTELVEDEEGEVDVSKALVTDPQTGELKIDKGATKEWWRLKPEERPYMFVWQQTPFRKACDDLEEMTGLSIVGLEMIGDQDIASITYQSVELMTFDEALLAFNRLLQERNYWILKRDDHLMIRQMSDWYRYTPWDHMYRTVEAFRKADLPAWEYASVIYIPEKAPPKMLAEGANDIVPMNTSVGVVVPGTNWIELKGFVHYIDKQLKYLEENDRLLDQHRKFKVYKLEYVDAADAVGLLQNMLVDPSEAVSDTDQPSARPSPRRGRRRPSRAPQPEEDVSVGMSTAGLVDIHPDERNNQLLIKATEAKHEEVAKYLENYIDTPTDTKVAELVRMEYADPAQVIEIIKPLLGKTKMIQPPAPKPKKGQKPQRPQPRMVTIGSSAVMQPVEDMNAILVKADDREMSLIKKYAEMLDKPQQEAGFELVRLEHVEASNMATLLQSAIGERVVRRRRVRRGGGEAEQFQAIPDMENSQVMVLKGEPEDIEAAKKLIKQLDVDHDADTVEHLVSLENATPTALSTILNSRFGGDSAGGFSPYRYRRYGRRSPGGGSLPQFLPQDENKLLIVICREQNWPEIDRLIKQVDEKSVVADTSRIHRLEHADARTVYEILRQSFGSGPRGRFGRAMGGPQFQYDGEQNMVVVTASDDVHERIGELIQKLDQPGPGDQMEIREIKLARADVSFVKDKVEEMLDQDGGRSRYRRSRSGGAAEPRIVAEPVSNRLLVTAKDEDFKKIEKLALEIDKDYEASNIQRKVFHPKHVQSSVLERAIASVFSDQSRSRYGRRGATENPGDVQTQAVGSTVVVTAPEEEMTKIEALVSEVDTAPGADNEFRTYTVQGAGRRGTRDIASTLQEIYGRSQTSEVKFFGDYGSTLLMVSAPADQMEEVDQRVQKIIESKESGELTSEIRHFVINEARPEDVADMIRPILETKYDELQQQKGGRRYYGRGGGPQITVHKSANKLMVAAPVELMSMAETLIEEFDQPARPSTTRIVTLQTAKAADVVPVVEQMMSQSGDGGGSRRSRWSWRFRRTSSGGGSSGDELEVVQVGQTSSIMLRGPEEKVSEAEKLIAELDNKVQPEGPMMVVEEIEHADVYEVVDMIEQMVGGGDFYGMGGGSSDVIVRTDFYSNKIFISAPRDKMPMIQHIIEVKEKMAKAARAEGETAVAGTKIGEDEFGNSTRTFTLGTDKEGRPLDVDQIAKELSKQLESYYGYWESPIVKSFPYANQLIVTGKPKQFKMVSQLLDKMQKNPPKSPLVIRYKRVAKGVPVDRVVEALKRSAPMHMQNKLNVQRVQRGESGGDPMGMIEEINYYDPIQKSSLPEKQEKKKAGGSFVPSTTVERLNASLSSLKWAQATEMSLSDENKKSVATTQPASATQPAKAEVRNQDVPAPDPSALPTDQTHIRYDPEAGVIYLVGPESQVSDIEGVMDEVISQYEEMAGETETDIRVFRVNYVDVSVAASILEQMFNEKKSRQSARQKARQKAKQPAPKPGPENEGEEGSLRSLKEQQQQDAEEEKARRLAGGERIRVIPDPRTRTLIVRAAEEDFPLIVRLLLKIDRPGDRPPVNIEIFQLTKLNAYDVEQAIKEILGIDERDRRSSRMPRRMPRGRGSAAAQARMIDQLQQEMLEMQSGGEGEEGIKLNPAEDINITSDAATNSVIVQAPQEGMRLVGDLIDKLEEQKTPIQIETVKLQNSDAVKVAGELEKLFQTGRVSRGRNGEGPPAQMGQVKIAADSRTNTLIVRALEPDMERIKPLIDQMDQDTLGEELELFTVENGDAESISKTLQQLFVGKQKGGGAISITPDPETNSILVRAPKSQRLIIKAKISELDKLASTQQTPKQIVLKFATPSEVAKTLRSIYLTSRHLEQQVTIEGDDNSSTLFVAASEEMFKQIEQTVEIMDKPSKQSVRVFKLEHAMATDVLDQLKQMATQMLAQLGQSQNAFAATADPRTNSLIVSGTPTTFLAIESVLKQVDIPPADSSTPTMTMFGLSKSRAKSVAQTINNLYRGREFPGGVPAPRAVAEPHSNVVYVYGTKQQIEQVKASVINPLEQYKPGPARELNTYQIAIEHADVNKVAQTLIRYFQQRQSNLRRAGYTNEAPSDTAITIQPDTTAGQLIVNSNEKNKKLIDKLLETMDVPEVTEEALDVRVFALEYAHPSYVAQAISNTFRQPADAPESQQVRVSTENYTKSLVVSANTEKMKKVEDLVTKLDKPAGKERITEVIKVENASASSLGQTLNKILAQSRGRTLSGQLPASVVPDDATNTLAVTANEKDLEDVKALITKLDVAPDEGQERLTRPYTLEYADYNSVSRAISSAFANQRSASIEDQVTVSAIWSTNTVVVTASEENHKKVADIVESIDTESSKKAQREVIALEHADATQLARTLNRTYYSERRSRRGGQQISITAAQDSNSLIVSAGTEDLKGIKALTKQLDKKPAEESERVVKPYSLENADAYAVSSVVARSFSKRGSRVEADQVDAVAERYTNTVVVTATPEKHEKIAAMIQDLDKETEDKLVQEVVKLEHADARQLASSLNRTYYYVQRNRRGGQPISIQGNRDTNSLIISAGQKDLEGIKKTVSLLDTAPEEGERSVKPYALENADVYGVAQVITRSFSKRGSRVEAERVEAVPERTTNTVVVTATPDKHEKIAAMIKDLDEESTNVSQEHVIKLEHADASELSRALTQTYRASRRGRRGGQITINAEPSSNSLIVAASESDFKGVKAMVAELDKPATEDMEEIRIIPLQYMDAGEAEEIMSDYLQKPGRRRRRGGDLIGNIKLSSSTSMNTLIVSGAGEDLNHIEKVIKDMDQEISGAGAPRIIPLEHASASQMATTLTQMFTEPAKRDPRSRRNPERVPTIMAEESTGSLVVRARENDFQQIKEMADKLDRETDGPRGVDIIEVSRQANLYQLAKEIEQTVNRGENLKARQIPGYRPAQVTIGVNERIPALIVGGSPELFDTVRETFSRFDELQGTEKSDQGAVVVPIRNMPARDIQQILQSIIEKQNGSRR